MLGKTHAITGLAAGLAVAAAAGLTSTTPLAAYVVAAGAALLPDLDQPRSMANRTVATKPAHIILRQFSHRGFTHSLLAISLFYGLMLGVSYLAGAQGIPIPYAYVIMATVGYSSHIFADMFNKEGVQLLYPFAPLGKRFWSMPIPRPLRISTIYEPSITFDPRSLQSIIHTEKLFWTYPMCVVIAFCAYAEVGPLLSIARQTLIVAITALPAK
jgi:inner membrane protein